MRFRYVMLIAACVTSSFVTGAAASARAQGTGGSSSSAQNSATPIQRLEVMRSRLETMRRSLGGAIAGLGGKKDGGSKAGAQDDPRARLQGLEKEVGSLLSEVSDVRSKQERAERYDTSVLDRLESAVNDINDRVEAALRATAGERRSTGDTAEAKTREKKKRSLLARLLGRGGDDKYKELVGTVAPGRDRQLFEEATRQARKDNYETARDLYNVIITTYPDSSYLPLAKLAIADTFYLEGTTSSLIQAGASYRDWLTFFPTDTLADDVMLKLAEVEMRKMGLPDRDVSPARKAEQQLKVLLQQFPNTSLRPEAEIRLREVQENLAMHNLLVGNQYYDRYFQGKASNPKGAQNRYREIVEKYPNFSYMDEVLYRLGITYIQEEEPDEAAKYFQQLARGYPGSKHADKAREQLEAIGAPAPDADIQKASLPPPPRPSFTEKIMREILGTTPVTVDKNGILISNSSKGGDLIEEAIRNGGQLPVTTPTVPVNRTAPARPLQPQPSPSNRQNNDGKGVTAQPTQPGAPKSGSDPTKPPATQPTTPATAPPPSGSKPQ